MLDGIGLRLCGVILASGMIAAPALAGTYTTIYQFTGGSDGAVPPSSLTYDGKGDLYGVAKYGGIACSDDTEFGCGTVFKLSPSGQETTLVLFSGPANGQAPQSPLTLVDHTLYGGTSAGGVNNQGVLFSVHADGAKFRLLHTFSGKDGSEPTGPLVAGPAGVFYGITYQGGLKSKNSFTGVLFELMPDGTYIQLHDFTGGADGGGPNALLIDPSGSLYGSTDFGATCPGEKSCGVVFQYVPSSGTFTVLHQFLGSEGERPTLGSIGSDGTLYGATRVGGPEKEGTLFDMIPSGATYSLNTLYGFGGKRSPGYQPSGGPILTNYGALVGTTTLSGTLYRFKFNKMETLYTLPAGSDASPPITNKSGIIYGASSEGGVTPCNVPGSTFAGGCGYIYSYAQ